MKRPIAFVLHLLLVSAAAAAQGPAASSLAGHYYLQGVRELGAELRLEASGRFEFGMAYGAVDQAAKGQWSADGRAVTLVADVDPAPRLVFGKREAELPHPYSADPPKPTLLVVRVTSPEQGLVWSNMEITAEFSNGKRRTGTTGQDGMLGFLAREDEDWKGARILRVSAAHSKKGIAPVWVDVRAPKDKSIVFHLEPGSLVAPAFKTMQLEIGHEPGGHVTLSLPGTEEGKPSGGRFVRRP